MNHHMIRVETYHGPETVQLTGRVDFASVEVFRRGKTEFVPKSRVLPEDHRRFPAEGKWRIEQEGGYFFIPEERVFTCEDKRVVWLANRVWRRLPAVERQVLHALETRVTDTDQTSFAGRYLLGSTFNQSGQTETGLMTKSYPAQYAEHLPHIAYLAEVKTLESEPAAMFVIAREFAKIVLRQPELFITAGSLMDVDVDNFYADHMMRQVAWGQDHATLQAWLWGFGEELQAYLAVKPNAFRNNWFTPKEAYE